MLYGEKVWYFVGVYSVYNKENSTAGLLGEIYFSSHYEKKYFPCSLHSLVKYSYNTQRQIVYLGAAM